MSDYTKQLEEQNEQLQKKLADTEKQLADANAELHKLKNPWATVLNELVSVQPMTAPVGNVYAMRYKVKTNKHSKNKKVSK